MSNWFQRYEERRRDLAQGADADLMKANRRRFWTAFGLIGLAGLLGLLDRSLHLPRKLEIFLRCVVVASGLVGVVMAKWAQHEHSFLTDPEPEKPPTIFRE
jgi:hypothetical protein